MTYESKKKWIMPQNVPNKIMLDIYKDVDILTATLLYNREVDTAEKIDKFFNAKVTDIPDYTKLYDTKRAVKVISDAIDHNKKIIVHGDFDVDGVCASAIIWELIYKKIARKIGKDIDILPYIPDRVDEGYGLTEKSVNAMIDMGAQLIISVDCGIRDKQIIEKYQKNGELDFVITDHHQLPDDFSLSDRYAIVHPAITKHEYPYTNVCGAFVAYLLATALADYYKLFDSSENSNEKDQSSLFCLVDGLDLVALATVTDMMPLEDINRIVVKEGLKIINEKSRNAFVAIAEVAGIKLGLVDSYHLGFVIGPRLNASGRIGSAMDALRLLVTDNYQYAVKIAFELNTLNGKRQNMTEEALNLAKLQLEAKGYLDEKSKLLFVVGEGWSEGIVGLVAGKLTETFSKPSIVVTKNNNECRGSARSIVGFNITEAIEQFSVYLNRYGGHAQAAGFSMDEKNLDKFESEIVAYANTELKSIDLTPEIQIDVVVNSDEINIAFPEKLNRFKPFGYGNRKPNIMIANAVILEKKIMGSMQNHLKLILKDSGFETINAVMFNCREDIDRLQVDDVINLVGSVELNVWNGNTDVQFMVKEWVRVV